MKKDLLDKLTKINSSMTPEKVFQNGRPAKPPQNRKENYGSAKKSGVKNLSVDVRKVRSPDEIKRALIGDGEYSSKESSEVDSKYSKTFSDEELIDDSASFHSEFQEIVSTIATASIDSVIVIDEVGKIRSLNDTACDLFGYRRWNLIEKNVKMLMPEKYSSKHDYYLKRYKLSKQARILGEVRPGIEGLHATGKVIPLILKVNQLYTTHGLAYIGVLKNVSESVELKWTRSFLKNTWPQQIQTKLMNNESISASVFASVAFIDIVGFTKAMSNVEPSEVFEIMNKIFETWDELARKHGVEKIKSIGDCYMCCCGTLGQFTESHANRIVKFCLAVIRCMKDQEFDVRCGIGTGLLFSGVTSGWKMQYDVLGDTVNQASRLEKISPVNGICVNEAAFKRTNFRYKYHAESIPIKGKGIMNVYKLFESDVFGSE